MSGEAIDGLFSGPQPGPLYLLESYWPGVSPARVAAADVETARLLGELGNGGPVARHLGSVLVPGDELLLRLFAGSTAALIEAANADAGVPVERVVAIVTLPPAPRAKSVGSLPLANEPAALDPIDEPTPGGVK